MKHFPSLRNVMYCCAAAIAIAVSIPVDPTTRPHAHSTNMRSDSAVPVLASVVQNNGAVNNSSPSTPSPPSTPAPSPGSKPGAQGNSTQPPSAASPTSPAPSPSKPSNSTANGTDAPIGPESWGYTRRKTAKLRIRAIDGRTRTPLQGAEVVVIETEQRFTTNKDGYTQWFDAPIFRNPKYRPMVAELHGQLGVIVYKNGYRDSIHLGIRMHEDIRQQTTVWMYKIEPGDRRVEPVLYQEPYHRLWLIQLADRYRQRSQIGEGPERP